MRKATCDGIAAMSAQDRTRPGLDAGWNWGQYPAQPVLDNRDEEE